MEVINKKVANLKNTEAIVQSMQGSTDPWLQAQKCVDEMINGRKLNKCEGKYMLVFAAGWIAEQYKEVCRQKVNLEGEVAAFCIQNQNMANDNVELRRQNEWLTRNLMSAQAAITELNIRYKRAEAEYSQCLTQIESLREQLGNHSADGAAAYGSVVGDQVCGLNGAYSDKGFVASGSDSGVEMRKVSDPLVANINSVAVDSSDEFVVSGGSSDNESVRMNDSGSCKVVQQRVSQSPCAQRKACVGRPALRCFVCKKFGHIARYCFAVKKHMQRNSRYPKTEPRHQEVYSARWSKASEHIGHNRQRQVSYKAQILNLQSENSQLKHERHQFITQLNELKMEVTSFMRKYNNGANNSVANSP